MELTYLCPLLSVFDMDASLRFYVEVLGFKIHQRAGEKDDTGWVWLTKGNVNLMLNTQYEKVDRPKKRDLARDANHNDTILYFGCAAVDGAYRELKGKGLQIQPPEIASYGMKQLYFHDPDGYSICLQWEHLQT
ncbi:MAG TPA: VOC family protein [Chryseosolibacter sp.]